MNRILFILLTFSFYIGNTQTNTGYIIYKASLSEDFEYSEDFKVNYPKEYKEMLTKDSIAGSAEIGVVFDKNMSRSFLKKSFEKGTDAYYNALYKINFDADYFYDTKTKTSKIKREFWFKKLLITVNLKDKWEIDTKITKTIDGYKCYYARYNGKYLWSPSPDRKISAWFTTDLPMPFGPLHYNGLPGLIIELNDDNVRLMATKIVFDKSHISKLKPIESSGTDEYDEYNFVKNREEIIKNAKKIIRGN